MNIKKSTLYGWLTAVILSVSALSSFDMYLDLTESHSLVHAVVEVLIIPLSLAPGLYFLRRWVLMRRKALNAEQQLREYLDGLGRRIEQEFGQWNLTDAEKKTAIYILKGMSHREIAAQCHRSEGTVRQHAVSVYRKAGLSSRAEFSAYFLQMLMAQLVDDEGEEAEVSAGTAERTLDDGGVEAVQQVSAEARSALKENISA
jgi:DNA-binding CsgD family transcriptional regulator